MKNYDHDSREREVKPGEYTIPAACEPPCVGQVTCYRLGLKLMDFYWTNTILVKDWVEPKKEP